ncbi:TM2 domain-containing protein [Hazenella coriacea]|uniref:PH (Pleckstrin Homology) domain-containing protein n=1 Tax=Hazenella coriacea TaxID=1179467 RepID=A0A4R3L0S6_9BACL|nr:TM2 domain-containing protein [Hazenella coriacea]TCS93143.1 PH (Pleckstrin Homology) domain-containing protein [Hazenella coriacea]
MDRKSMAIAYVLWLFTGLFGGHRYYIGDTRLGIFMSLTLGGCGILFLVDMVMLYHCVERFNNRSALENSATYSTHQIRFIQRWIGDSPTPTQQQMLKEFHDTFVYLSQHIDEDQEHILKAIPVKMDQNRKKKQAGILVSTSKRLVYANVKDFNPTITSWEYEELRGIDIQSDGIAHYHLTLELTEHTVQFKEIKNNHDFEHFIQLVGDLRNRLHLHRIEQKYDDLKQLRTLEPMRNRFSQTQQSIKAAKS